MLNLKLIFVITIILFLQITQQQYQEAENGGGDSEKIDFKFYHTTDLNQIKQNCKYPMTLKQVNTNPDLRIVDFNLKKDLSYRGYLLFGEHPREMISPETGLNIVKALCGQTEHQYDNVDFIMNNYELRFMINANPESRKRVEQGEYCRRENENDVDINRNYDAHWEYVDNQVKQVSSGKAPFSEIETQKIKETLDEFKPDYFITVHSGTLGLYTPYAYSTDEAQRNEGNMIQILNQINDKYCKDCEVGAAGKEVGYLCPGSSLDYVYDSLDTKYSFAMEIYTNKVDIRQQLLNKASRNYLRKNSFLQQKISEEQFEVSDYQMCFLYFNPPDEEYYNFVVDNWTKAILESMELAARIENAQKNV